MTKISTIPGPVVLIGSGETSPASGAVFEKIARQYEPPLRIAVLETPAGFELNSNRVAGRVGDFLSKRLQNYNPIVDVIPARKKGGENSPDNEAILEPLYKADLIFLGPGSPTYTARQLDGSLAYEIIQARQRTGASLVLASAATIAFGVQTLPVYEIFKAGMDLHWKPGLDFFRHYGLNLIIIPHWNNTQGGSELDTSRCFMGMDRFDQLKAMLDREIIILGIDEHTALWLDPKNETHNVFGKGKVHLIKDGVEAEFIKGDTVPIELTITADPSEGIRTEIQTRFNELREESQVLKRDSIPENLQDWVQLRETARKIGNFSAADAFRAKITEAGWKVTDTGEGPRLERIK
jgi:hypothetical protein